MQKKLKISGYAAIFGIQDSQGDIISRNAFDTTLNSGKIIHILYEHYRNSKIGFITSAIQNSKGLYINGIIDLNDSDDFAQNLAEMIISGFINGLSIGYKTLSSFYNKSSLARYLTSIDLREISIVKIPANPYTVVSKCYYFDK